LNPLAFSKYVSGCFSAAATVASAKETEVVKTRSNP